LVQGNCILLLSHLRLLQFSFDLLKDEQGDKLWRVRRKEEDRVKFRHSL
jgi:hypothetical protein